MDTNPYAPPAEREQSPASPLAGTRPSYAPYSPKQVVLAGFLGSPIAGAILLFLNYRRQGRARDATTALVGGGVATAALIALSFLLPDHTGNFLPIAAVLALRRWANMEQPVFDAHVAAGGAKASWWNAAGVGVAALVGLLLLMVPAAVGWDALAGHHVDFGGGQMITYEQDATEADARKLGAYLREAGFFHDAGKRKDVALKKSGVRYDVSFVIHEGAWDKPDVVDAFQTLRDGIATHAFPGSTVVVDLCDDSFSVKKAVSEQ